MANIDSPVFNNLDDSVRNNVIFRRFINGLQASRLEDASFVDFVYNLDSSVLISSNFINALTDLNAKDDDILTNSRFTGVVGLMKSEFLSSQNFVDFINSFNTREELDVLESRGDNFNFLGRLRAGYFEVLSELDSSVQESFSFNEFVNTIDMTSFGDRSFRNFINTLESSTLTNEYFAAALSEQSQAVLTNGLFTDDLERIDKSFLESIGFYQYIKEVASPALAARGQEYESLPSVGGYETSPEEIFIAKIPDSLSGSDNPPLSSIGTITGGSTEGERVDGAAERVRTIGFREFRSPENPNAVGQTWVVIHGWNDSPIRAEGFEEIDNLIGSIVSQVGSNDRVLALDWREAAGNNSVRRAATWIGPTAKFAVEALKQTYKVDGEYAKNRLNIVGHSLGPYVASEIGRLFKEDNDVGVRTITSIDASTSLSVPNLNNPDADIQFTPFSDVSAFSRSFFADSLFGSREAALTADEAYLMDFSFNSGSGPIDNHRRAVRAFASLGQQTRTSGVSEEQTGTIRKLIGVPSYVTLNSGIAVNDFGQILDPRNQRRERDATRFEGILEVNNGNEVVALYAQRGENIRDSIVIGGDRRNDDLEGLEVFRRGQSSSIVGNSRFFGDGNDLILGGGGDDRIEGKGGDDILSGGSGIDSLYGGSGRDILYGGDESDAKVDNLTGGTGVDIFAVRAQGTATSVGRADLISDFELGIDKIGLLGNDLNTGNFVIEDVEVGSVKIGASIRSGETFLAVLKGYSASAVSGRITYTSNDFNGNLLDNAFDIT